MTGQFLHKPKSYYKKGASIMKKDLRFVRTAIIALIAFAMFACTYASADNISDAFPGIYGGGESADVLADIGNNDMLPENADCIKVYSISPSEFSDLASGRVQNANMTGNDKNVRWYFISENGSIAKAQKLNGKWTIIGRSEPSADAVKNSTLTTSAINKYLNEKSSVVTGMANNFSNAFCVDVPEYHTSFVVFDDGNVTYVCPFGSRPDLTGLENGKEYTATEAMNILSTNFASFAPMMENEFGGAGAPSPVSTGTKWAIPVAIIVVSAVIVVTVITVKKKTKSASA